MSWMVTINDVQNPTIGGARIIQHYESLDVAVARLQVLEKSQYGHIEWVEPERTLGPMEERAKHLLDQKWGKPHDPQKEVQDFIQHLARAVDDLTQAVR